MLGTLWARARGSLWPLPVAAIVLAIGLGIAMPALDGALTAADGDHPLTGVFGGGPSAARDILAVMAGSLISVTGLTFSLTVVALQLGSSQYSPRLLQTFVTDRVVQLTLAQLMATFVYALTVLRTVRTEDDTRTAAVFVPRLSISVGYLLTLGSVIALMLFLGHLAQSLRVETMMRDVHHEGTATLWREVPDDHGSGAPHPPLPTGPSRVIRATSSGFVVAVDTARLAAAAREADATVVLAHRVGDAVVAGTPLAHAWPATPAPQERLGEAVVAAVQLGFERSPAHDIAYSLRKVVDIVVRALSPGTNDPTTAVHGLSHVSAMLVALAGRSLAPTVVRDDDGRLRAVVPQWQLPDLVELALEEPLQVAGGQPAVLRRTAHLLREFAYAAPPGCAATVSGLLGRLCRTARDTTAIDEAELAGWQRDMDDALRGTWGPEVARGRPADA